MNIEKTILLSVGLLCLTAVTIVGLLNDSGPIVLALWFTAWVFSDSIVRGLE